MTTTILRLGHRPQRDKRLSTHLLLAARAFGADNAIYAGVHDPMLEESIQRIVEEWGGEFKLEYTSNFRKVIRDWQGTVVHLTMYGLPVQDIASVISESEEPLLVVVGGPKVPRDVYETATWNVSVTTQPHSEVSALAIFMYMLYGEQVLSTAFKGARLSITPTERSKAVNDLSKD